MGTVKKLIERIKGIDRARLVQGAKIIGEVAPLLATLGGTSKWMGRVGIGIKLTEIGYRIVNEHRPPPNLWATFNKDPAEWTRISWYVGETVQDHLIPTCMVAERVDGWKSFVGKLGDADLGWIVSDSGTYISMYVKTAHHELFARQVKEISWECVGSSHACVRDSKVVAAPPASISFRQTSLMDLLEGRVEAFNKAGECRSYMIIGAPGTGKTTSMHALATKKNWRSLYVPLAELIHGTRGLDVLEVQLLVLVMKPDIVIFDDIDRLNRETQGQILDLVARTRSIAKVTIASVNNERRLIAPLRRAERFDDHIYVPLLAPETVQSLLGPHAPLFADRVADWPFVYIQDLRRRADVLGVECAEAEFAALAARIQLEHLDELEPANGVIDGAQGQPILRTAAP